MDKFGVPKKINRHVLKAIYTMHENGHVYPNVDEICDAVEITMRNNVPVGNLHSVVSQALQNMRHCGVIEGNGEVYCVREVDVSPSVSAKSSNDSELSRMSERDVKSGSLSSGTKESLDDLPFEADYVDVPRKRRRLSRGSLDGLETGNSDGVNEQGIEGVREEQDIQKTSSVTHNLPGIQIQSQSLVKFEPKSANSKTSNLFRNKSQETFPSPSPTTSEHDSFKTEIKPNTEEASSSVSTNEDKQGEEKIENTLNRLLPKAEEHGK